MNAPFLRPEDPEVRAAQVRSRNSQERVHAGAASAMSFLVGQTLLTEATALELKSESDEADPLWIAAVLLMILGAIYAGKLTLMSAKCCLRRLQWVNEPQAAVSNDGDESSSSATKDDVERRSGLRWRTSTSSSSGPVQAPSAGSSSSGPVQAPSAGSSCSGPVQALGVSGPVQASSSTTLIPITAERAGPVQASRASSSSSGLEQALQSTNAAARASSSGAGPEQALRAGAGPVQAVAAAVDSGPGQASSSSGADHFADASGLEQALAAVAQISESAAAGGGIEHALMQRAGEVSEALRVGAESKATLHNPWNLFQHQNRGKGWSPAKMASMYKTWRASPKDKMP